MTSARRVGDALEAYRRGHDRVWETIRMISPADTSPPEVEWSAPPPPPRFGVEVSSDLEFHRGPDNWRPGVHSAPQATESGEEMSNG